MVKENKKSDNTAQTTLPMLPASMVLFRESLDLFKERFIVLISITVLPMFAILLGSLLLVFLEAFLYVSPARTFFLAALGIVALFIIQVLSQIAVYEVILEKNVIGIKEALMRAKGKLISYLGTAFLYIVILLGGFLLFIIPGFVFLVWFMFSLVIVVAEEKQALDALRTSREYIREYFGSVLARWLFLIVAFVLFLISLSILSWMIFGSDSGIGETFTSALIVIVSPIGSIYFVKLYQALRRAKTQNE